MEQDADLKSSRSHLLGDYLRNKEALNYETGFRL